MSCVFVNWACCPCTTPPPARPMNLDWFAIKSENLAFLETYWTFSKSQYTTVGKMFKIDFLPKFHRESMFQHISGQFRPKNENRKFWNFSKFFQVSEKSYSGEIFENAFFLQKFFQESRFQPISDRFELKNENRKFWNFSNFFQVSEKSYYGEIFLKCVFR